MTASGDFFRENATDTFSAVGLSLSLREESLFTYEGEAPEGEMSSVFEMPEGVDANDFSVFAARVGLAGTSNTTVLTASLRRPGFDLGGLIGAGGDFLMGAGVVSVAGGGNLILNTTGYDTDTTAVGVQQIWGLRPVVVEGASGTTDTTISSLPRNVDDGLLQVGAGGKFNFRRIQIRTRHDTLFSGAPLRGFRPGSPPNEGIVLPTSVNLSDYFAVYFRVNDFSASFEPISVYGTSQSCHGRQLLRASKGSIANLTDGQLARGQNVLPLAIEGGLGFIFPQARVLDGNQGTHIDFNFLGGLASPGSPEANSRVFGVTQVYGVRYELFDPDV